MERAAGIEPASSAWKAEVIAIIRCPHFSNPKNSNRREIWWREKDSNLRRQSRQIYSLIPLAAREPLRLHECHNGNSACTRCFCRFCWANRRQTSKRRAFSGKDFGDATIAPCKMCIIAGIYAKKRSSSAPTGRVPCRSQSLGVWSPCPRNSDDTMTTEHNPYLQFTREQWALLRDAVPLTLTRRTCTPCVASTRRCHCARWKRSICPFPVCSISTSRPKAAPQSGAGAVSRPVPWQGHLYHQHRRQRGGGKSTTARILQALLERWPEHPRVELGYHGWLPLSQQGAGRAWADAPQGFSGILRHPPSGGVCRQHPCGSREGRGPRLFSPHLRHPAR